jgi:hypothetical protein
MTDKPKDVDEKSADQGSLISKYNIPPNNKSSQDQHTQGNSSPDHEQDEQNLPTAVGVEQGAAHVNQKPHTHQSEASFTTAETVKTPSPAAWKSVEPSGSWCPPEIVPKLGFNPTYSNDASQHAKTLGDWCVTAATKRGKLHAHKGQFRQDAFHWKYFDRFAVYCVSDGAGSAKFSQVGSEYTARWICELIGNELLRNEKPIQSCTRESLRENLNRVAHYAVCQVANRLAALAVDGGFKPRDFRCTVLLVLHYLHPTGGVFVFGNVGDGFIAIKPRGQPGHRLGASDSGAFSGEVTCFMPDPEIGEYIHKSLSTIEVVPDSEVEAILACTDGIEDPFFPLTETIPQIFANLENGGPISVKNISYPEEIKINSVLRAEQPGPELLKWISFEKRGENDDRTALLIYRKPEGQITGLSKINPVDLKEKIEDVEEKRVNEDTQTQEQVPKKRYFGWKHFFKVLALVGLLAFLIVITLRLFGTPSFFL